MPTKDLTKELQLHYLHIKQAVADAHFWYLRYLSDLETRYKQRLKEIDQVYLKEQKQAGTQQQDALITAEKASKKGKEKATEQLGQLHSAFRWVVISWEAVDWQEYVSQSDMPIPSVVRVGHLAISEDVDFVDIPALVPLLGKGHIFVEGGQPEAERQILQTLLLRLMVTFSPGTLRLILADPVRMGADLSAFLRLPDSIRGEKVYSRTEEIEHQLDVLEKQIETIIQSRLQNIHQTIESYNEQAGEIAVPYRVLVLSDFPAGFNDRTVERLMNIAKNGPRAGVYILASLNSSYAPPRNFEIANLTSTGTVLNFSTGKLTWNDPEFGQYPILPDALPSTERINQLLDSVGHAGQQVSISLTFNRIAIPERERWKGNATDGLYVPIGINSTGEIHNLEIGGEGVVHHGLLGGVVGSGKSNLLHVLVTQLALRYTQEELEMYLVDFKEGIEFQDYITLPHARAVGLESEREFGRSILRHLQVQLEERGRRFKATGSNNLPTFRHQTGQPLPRILLLMDEFQVLFAEDDSIARESGQILEDLVRRGRAFGIHIILSSQTPSTVGMYSNRIYGQMGLRIALRCQPKEAEAILGEGNTAADRLERPGDAVYNDEMGHKEKNVQVRVALLPPAERREYLQYIRSLAHARPFEPPVTFEGRAAARLEVNPELCALLEQPNWSARPPAAHSWLGEPIEIKPPTSATLEHYARSNLLIVGGDEVQAHGLLSASLLSLAAQYSPQDVRFTIADFARTESPAYGLFTRITLPHHIEVVGPRQVGTLLTQLLALLDQRLQGEAADPEIYFIIAGLHRWRELRGTEQYTQSEPAKQLTRLAEEGPEVGIHLIAWADGFASIERTFKRSGVGFFDLRVILRIPEKDSNDLLGSNAAAKLGENRAFFRHEDWEMGRLEKFKPYSVPDESILKRFIEQLTAKKQSGRNYENS